jgi:hypothetical protein
MSCDLKKREKNSELLEFVVDFRKSLYGMEKAIGDYSGKALDKHIEEWLLSSINRLTKNAVYMIETHLQGKGF